MTLQLLAVESAQDSPFDVMLSDARLSTLLYPKLIEFKWKRTTVAML